MSAHRSGRSRRLTPLLAVLVPAVLAIANAPAASADTAPIPVTAADVQFFEGTVQCVNDQPVWTNPYYVVPVTPNVTYTPASGTYQADFGSTVAPDAAPDPGYVLTNQASFPETYTFAAQPPAPVGCVPLAANDDSYARYGNTSWKLHVLANDTAPNGDPMVIHWHGAPSNRDFKVSTDTAKDAFVVKVPGYFEGHTATFQYTMEDTVTNTVSDPATVSIYVKPVKLVTGHRKGHYGIFRNRNPFWVKVKVCLRAEYPHLKNKFFKIAPNSTKRVWWHKAIVLWLAYHYPKKWQISYGYM